jgi:hypothetical protein
MNGTLPISVEATAKGLFLMVGRISRYLLRTSMRLMCIQMVHLIGFLTLHIK